MQSLQFLIDMLTKGRKLHISILDLNGILNTPAKEILLENVTHSKPFCKVVKSTKRGLRLCLYCKNLANTKAVTEKMPFGGYCPYGLYEVAMPVLVDKAVAAVIYVGNAVTDPEQTIRKIDQTCRHTKVDIQKLYEHLEECEAVTNINELFGIAELIGDYIKLLCEIEPTSAVPTHWLVSALKQHADRAYCSNPTLKELSVIYHKSDKYLGRLFKKEMKISFHQYCLSLKLQKARELLLGQNDKIIDIALECGFNNISYFNRAFREQYAMSPSECRKRRQPID